ncbi:3-phosphoshikimate 1-carboxyvinyltransferase [Weeksella virosa]|uniref:3-phosphoshikimate 1-carboxyvinyltransferase n=1 Tax=Weeksella virosa (strain ATCC 43766 / DSM 16922 / JCM 21250 / CCUG 30538 / CDC 9751 / IAM 14551 / NBRC 16016 / NCTC 11634 / CL345/78) TaxID=865938 RepID=F0NXU8_WEEVC|nr:3-phosphoshikimate 1-carboxyvinyltransferase [Weeksella virosa]ADX68016.1 3-phosphoshikimate 1-carboxyvinyltransferase [Weeksella virosa DSM 16922]VEH64351.1 3-phosphoshikimate 1-carboxyvinyltransferase [Weeksella virosa]
MIHLSYQPKNKLSPVKITGSKSESNRLLLLNALFDDALDLQNLSNAEDTQLMQNALKEKKEVVDIHHAGTAMRFLTAYFAIQNKETHILTGSQRMKERPIKILVDALKELGAEIEYLENDGFPPLKITGTELTQPTIDIPANISSQYITALLLIGTKLVNGLTINLIGKITSLPYLMMSVELLKNVGIEVEFTNNQLVVAYSKNILPQVFEIESDWSSASYFYSFIALSEPETTITIQNYRAKSLQGDAALQTIYRENFGVESSFEKNCLTLKKIKDFSLPTKILLDLNQTPDIAQTLAVTCLGLEIPCHFTGLETLKIKETDRLVALQNELSKFGAKVNITQQELSITAYNENNLSRELIVETYNDHRMAMAFAPLAILHSFSIKDPDVVKKSYPNFWSDWTSIGFVIRTAQQ